MKSFLVASESDLRSAFIWNSVGGMINAGQSALLLIMISHTNSVNDAGVFALAFAIANLTLAMGKYGMRHFQSSDVTESYSFSEYLASRHITDMMMLLLTMYYIVKGVFFLSYTTEKLMAIILMTVIKLTDSVEDVYHGRLQQLGRLDIAAKCMTVRYVVVIIGISIALMLTRDLNMSLLVGGVFSWAFFFYSYSVFASFLHINGKTSVFERKVWRLLMECIVIAMGAFLMMYIANAPKYAIDAHMNEEKQACFNYIFMPVYVVGVLSSFIFQPLITKMARYLEEGRKFDMLRLFLFLGVAIFFIGICVLGGGYLLGIPVLSWLYNTDLTAYKSEFLILLLGGCVLAYASFFAVCVTIFRQQNMLLAGYVIPAVAEYFLAERLVVTKGVYGASVLYTSVIGLQAVVFLLVLGWAFQSYGWDNVQSERK